MESAGGAADQDILAPDLLPHPPTPDFLGEVGLNLAFCLVTSIETGMLLVGVKVHEHWQPV